VAELLERKVVVAGCERGLDIPKLCGAADVDGCRDEMFPGQSQKDSRCDNENARFLNTRPLDAFSADILCFPKPCYMCEGSRGAAS
jgi:hypothetical protein